MILIQTTECLGVWIQMFWSKPDCDYCVTHKLQQTGKRTPVELATLSVWISLLDVLQKKKEIRLQIQIWTLCVSNAAQLRNSCCLSESTVNLFNIGSKRNRIWLQIPSTTYTH